MEDSEQLVSSENNDKSCSSSISLKSAEGSHDDMKDKDHKLCVNEHEDFTFLTSIAMMGA